MVGRSATLVLALVTWVGVVSSITVAPYFAQPQYLSVGRPQNPHTLLQPVYLPLVRPLTNPGLAPPLPAVPHYLTLLPQQTVAHPAILHNHRGVPTLPPNILYAVAQSQKTNQVQTVPRLTNNNPVVYVTYPNPTIQQAGAGLSQGLIRIPAAALVQPTRKVVGTSRLPVLAPTSHQEVTLESIDRQYDDNEPQSVKERGPVEPPFKDEYKAVGTNQKQSGGHASSGESQSGGNHKGSSAGDHGSSGEGHSKAGKKGGHHHESLHHKDKGQKGSSGKKGHETQYSQGGGQKDSHHDSGHYGGDHHEYGGGGEEAGFKEGGHKKKSGFTKGFRDKYHKDEYHKLAKFWKDGHESGKYEKFGQKASSHYGDNSAHKKGETHGSGESGSKYGKKGQSAKGHDETDHSGHNKEKGGSQQYSHHTEYAKKGSNKHQKKQDQEDEKQ